jgi:hypothetical protein
LSIAIPFYFAAILHFYISESQELSNIKKILTISIVIIVALTLVILLSKLFNSYQEKLKLEIETEKATLFQAYTLCDRVITNRLKNIKKSDSDSELQSELITSKEALQDIIDAAYQTFESTYGKTFINNERINFEVTFMTKSYVDDYITIPASANKDGRSPLSMVLRKTKPEIFENTISANIYRETRPNVKIIEDTSNQKFGYEELYAHQLDRIKSSIISPVFSNTNELLGTLVVHCDLTNFFNYDKLKYWTNLLEIFAKRLAFEKAKLDLLNYLTLYKRESITLDKNTPF